MYGIKGAPDLGNGEKLKLGLDLAAQDELLLLLVVELAGKPALGPLRLEQVDIPCNTTGKQVFRKDNV